VLLASVGQLGGGDPVQRLRQRISMGDWLGVVTYQLGRADDRAESELLQDQLMPFYALRPRTDSVPLDGKPRDPVAAAASSRLDQRRRGRLRRAR